MRLAPPLLLLCLLSACPRPETPAAYAIVTVGGPGSTDGRFALPRAMAWDPRGFLYVVDKSARIQKFDSKGTFLKVWSTPEWEKGRPTGLAVDPEGRLLVADTHYHRVLRYSPEGELLSRFGSEGRAPGQFLYPTGILARPDGTIFVSEYGGSLDNDANDRVQVFTAEGKYLRGWGRYGEAPGEFRRPQGIVIAGDRLYVADAANHRIQVFTLMGGHLASWGDLRYPYSVSVDPDGNILVAQYGRHCVSKFKPDGTPLASAGKPGCGPDELNTPWCAVSLGDRIAVVDSGNNRVQLWPAGMLESPK